MNHGAPRQGFFGHKGQTVGAYMKHPPVVPPTMADYKATLSGALHVVLDIPQKAQVSIAPAVWSEHD